MHLPA
jgi:transposase InsO family protein